MENLKSFLIALSVAFPFAVQAASTTPMPASGIKWSHRAPAKADADIDIPITGVIQNPEGEAVNYTKTSAGTFVFQNGIYKYKDEFPATLIFGKDNEVYFKNIFSIFPDEYYVMGTIEGDIITVKTNQTIEYELGAGYGLNFGVLKTVPGIEDGEEVIYFQYAPEIESVQFKIDENDNISLILPCEPFDGENPPEYVIGLYYTDNGQFTGFCDFSQEYAKMDLQLIEIPSGAEIENYVYVDDYNHASVVDVAFYNGYLYIRGLNSNLPEATIRGRIDGNMAYIEQDEYLGIYFDQFYIFTKVVYDNPDYVAGGEDEDYTGDEEGVEPFIFAPADVEFPLVIDYDNKTITSNNEGVYLSYHGDPEDIFNTLGYYEKFVLKYQDTFAGTPANPSDLEYTTDFADAQGFNDFFFTLANYSTEGTMLDTKWLYYKVFVDGKAVVFKEDMLKNLLDEEVVVYEGVPTSVELLPYMFENNNDIFKYTENMFDVGIYVEDVKTIGVQTVYYYENVYTYSDIVTLNVETNEVTTSPWDSGVESVVSPEVIATEYYTVDGLKVSNPARGLFIKVSRNSDGSVKTTKEIKKF